MDFEELVYDHTTYLRDNGFIVSPGNYELNIFIYKDFDLTNDNFSDILYFVWEDVCDDLEPLIIKLYNMDLLDYITICNSVKGNIKFTFPDKGSDGRNLDSIFSNISKSGNLSDIVIYCKYVF